MNREQTDGYRAGCSLAHILGTRSHCTMWPSAMARSARTIDESVVFTLFSYGIVCVVFFCFGCFFIRRFLLIFNRKNEIPIEREDEVANVGGSSTTSAKARKINFTSLRVDSRHVAHKHIHVVPGNKQFWL